VCGDGELFLALNKMNQSAPWEKNWIVIEPLDGGGQGDTLLVKPVTGEPVKAVLKLLKAGKASDAKARGRMAQEVINLRFLRTAGGKVPHVLESNTEKFEDPNVPLFFVMELIQGTTLAKAVQESGGLGVKTSLGVALDLCSTMSVATKEGIIHRDIKPENIILRAIEPADVVMVDFGLSFNEDESSNLTETEETLDNKFLSLPERRGPGENKRDPRSDLTGICAILFYCLTTCSPRNLRDSQGRPPHRWPSAKFAERIPDAVVRGALDLLLSRGLGYELDLRFQSIDDLTNRLKEILTPQNNSVIEDLDTVLVRETAALRRNDRKTQLSEYFNNVQPLQQSINLRYNDISRKLQGNRNFYLVQHQDHFQSYLHNHNENDSRGELVARRFFGLGVQNHQLVLQIHYYVIAQGPECVFYREIREGHVHQQGQAYDPPVILLRYLGETSPDATIVVKDMDAAVARAITLLSHKIQGGK
jgi:serine/threonine protein kinase